MKKTMVVFLALCAAVAMCGLAYADCPDSRIICIKLVNGQVYHNGVADDKGNFKTGNCWKSWGCELCYSHEALGQECNSKFSLCEGNCAACVSWTDTYGIAGPCWDKTGKEVYRGISY